MKKIKIFILLVCSCFVHKATAQWVQQVSNSVSFLNSICFTSHDTGYVAGNLDSIFKTTNGGTSWIKQYDGAPGIRLNSVFFPSANTGYACGDSGVVLKTTDAGASWTKHYTGSSFILNSTYFTDVNTGYVGGYDSAILKTTDGGINWVRQPFIGSSLFSIFFTATDTGYAVGSVGAIIKTTDGGTNWVLEPSPAGDDLKSVYFVNRDTGFVAGGMTIGYPGDVYKTVDGGAVWTHVMFFGISELRSTYFFNGNKGYALEDAGYIWVTNDGGANWTLQYGPGYGRQIVFVDDTTGYVVGGYGIIMKTTNGGTIGIEENEMNNNITLSPNPTTGVFAITTKEKITQIKIFNLLGEEIKTINNTTTVDLIDFPLGIYFVEIKTEKGIARKKIIKQ